MEDGRDIEKCSKLKLIPREVSENQNWCNLAVECWVLGNLKKQLEAFIMLLKTSMLLTCKRLLETCMLLLETLILLLETCLLLLETCLLLLEETLFSWILESSLMLLESCMLLSVRDLMQLLCQRPVCCCCWQGPMSFGFPIAPSWQKCVPKTL